MWGSHHVSVGQSACLDEAAPEGAAPRVDLIASGALWVGFQVASTDEPGAATYVRFEVAVRAQSVTAPPVVHSFTVYVDGTAVATIEGRHAVPALDWTALALTATPFTRRLVAGFSTVAFQVNWPPARLQLEWSRVRLFVEYTPTRT
ncbi:MAG: hypothetical protein OXG33_15020 [Chloroflexi bacterium]|nr:hypothetical protein [Chloroflexota bacterium]